MGKLRDMEYTDEELDEDRISPEFARACGYASVEEAEMAFKADDMLEELEADLDTLNDKEIVCWLIGLSELKLTKKVLKKRVLEALVTIMLKYELSVEVVEEKYGLEVKECIFKMFNEAMGVGIDVEKIFLDVSEELE